jgi:hypothetical protein
LAFLELYGSSSTQLAIEEDREPENERIRPIRIARDVPGLKFASKVAPDEKSVSSSSSPGVASAEAIASNQLALALSLDDNDADSGVPSIVLGGGSGRGARNAS